MPWDSECLRISYINVTKRWYVPDFFVEYTAGRKEIWEIKPKEFVDSRACQLKTEAAQKYCEQSAIDAYVILTRDDPQVQRNLLNETSPHVIDD